MASITKRDTRNGTSFKITVCTGMDTTGKQKRHFMTWKAPPGMNAKQAEKKAKQVAAEFEKEIEYGFQADNNQTFSEYAQYVIDQKARHGVSPSTISIYRSNLRRIGPAFGGYKLRDVRPQHINRLYEELARPAPNPDYDYSTPLIDFREAVKGMGHTMRTFAAECGFSESTAKGLFQGGRVRYRNALKAAEFIGEPVDDVFSVEYHSYGMAPQTIQRIHSLISEVFKYAEMEMIVTINPAKRVRPPRVETTIPNYFQPEQVAAILAAADKEPIQWRAMVYMFALTGARRGEVCSMKWKNLDWEKKQIKIDSSLLYTSETGVQDGPTKTRNTRFVPLPDELFPILKKLHLCQLERRLLYGDQWEDSDYLFTRERGGSMTPSDINRRFKNFSEKYGLPHINPHAFRHTAASIMISAGTDVISVAKVLGHATPVTTERIYSHEIEEAKQTAAGCISGAILGKKQA